tara:strand:+ start:292 stop:393 length:102 start_codon:yes stop_codon:yes gene_type:complete
MDLDDFEIKNKEVFIGTVVFLSTMITGYIISYI